MNQNKIGTIFLVSMLALAGLGISYAGFSDLITVYGNVNTATVDITVEDYSGTDVWKVWGQGAPTDEKYVFRGFVSDPLRPTTEAAVLALVGGEHAELVASSWADEGTDYDVIMTYDNLFPCIDFTADVIIHYDGSIPAKVSAGTFIWDVTGFDFSPYTTVKYYWYTKDDTNAWIKGDEVTTIPVQMHNCQYLGIEVIIHLEQDNALQGKSGAFEFNIQAIQWNEQLPYNYYPSKNIGSGSLSITGTGWKAVSAWLNPAGYDFATNRHSFDLTTACQPIALQGFIDTTQAALSNPNDWSKYFFKCSIRDSSNRIINVVFANSWLGTWYEIPPHPWDRISLETENVPGFGSNTPHAEQWYATQGGVLGYNMNGQWVGEGNGAMVYPSDQNYFFQLIADSDAGTFTLEVYAMGSSAPANPPAQWPKQNMFDYPTWLQIGSITIAAGDFNFAEVEFYAILWASTQAGAEDTSIVSWNNMHVGAPVSFSEIP